MRECSSLSCEFPKAKSIRKLASLIVTIKAGSVVETHTCPIQIEDAVKLFDSAGSIWRFLLKLNNELEASTQSVQYIVERLIEREAHDCVSVSVR